ncbi:DUF1415 domain-containing protein [Diaphorobacter sp. HDW4A]|nr:DUF1415 domain-containing protein [Diaphorobacter sp. HDW4A]QIL81614.1 DUF1415 domain-containing protein [Diaphorobacter sp. HDW4A]
MSEENTSASPTDSALAVRDGQVVADTVQWLEKAVIGKRPGTPP